MALLMRLRSTVSSRCKSDRTQALDLELQARGARHARELGHDAVEHRAHRKVRVLRLDAARVEASHIQQRIEQIAERRQGHARLVQVIEIETLQRRLADRFQEQQRRTQGLSEIVAGRREKSRLGLVGTVGQLLRLLQGQFDFAPRLQLRHQAQVELFVLLGAMANGLLETGGGLKPGEGAALLVDRLLHALHQRLHRFFERAVLRAQRGGGICRARFSSRRRRLGGSRASLRPARRSLGPVGLSRLAPGRRGTFAPLRHGSLATPKQVNELFA
jgi:hypothetical protein